MILPISSGYGRNTPTTTIFITILFDLSRHRNSKHNHTNLRGKTFFHVKRSAGFNRMAKTQTTRWFNVSTRSRRLQCVNDRQVYCIVHTPINKVFCHGCWQSPNQTNTILPASKHMTFSFYLVDHNLFT